ncbi:metallophosphoesterase [Bacillus sp. 165]|uniref:metallophosphoesterase n=1 Tax=Bacillus sp. 165 TaxID=1529117 RepID=UPI001ADB7C69|nr:metallophosphoesterase [Bacillus sp. 165]MBO9130533.1 metallophosphoesterase [Bacillus sp. 165]
MRALIVSDSHGLTSELEALKKKFEHDVDIMIHCGDSELSVHNTELAGFEVVKGNCDFNGEFLNEIVKDVGEIRFFVTHGHLYNIKMTVQSLWYRAKELEATVACFGHSHIMGAELLDGILLINPGSILLPRSRKERTYAVLEWEEKNATVTFFDLDGRIVAMQSFILG